MKNSCKHFLPLQYITTLICLTILSPCYYNTFARENKVTDSNDTLTRAEILNIGYPSNPITHETIKFVNGLYVKHLPGSDKTLKIQIEEKNKFGLLTGKKLPGLAAFITADSGNGTKYTYLTAFLKDNGTPYLAASILLGPEVTIDHLIVEDNNIDIWWLRYLEGDKRDEPSHIVCRNYTLRNDSLIDDDYEARAEQKRALENDTVFTNSVTTGFWTVKWNKTHAAVFFNLTGEGEDIYEETNQDIDDNDFYAGDSIETYFNPGWYYNTSYDMLSVVGPYVSFLASYDGSGGMHPIVGTTLGVFEINTHDKSNPPAKDTAVDPMKIMEEVKNHKDSDVKSPLITDIFPEQEVFNALMKDSIILASLNGKNPANLKQLIPDLDGGCAIDFTYLLESFAFKSIHNNNVVVEFGLTHGCEVEKGTFTVIDIELPVPEYNKQMFIEAAKNKSTMEGINPGFIQETKQEKIDEALEIIAEQHREDSIKVVEKRENDFRTYFDQGRDYCSDGNYEKAIIDLTKALEILPDNIETLNWRTIAYMNSQDYDKSMADCSRILKLNPNYAEAYLHRGILYSFNQEHDKAISDYNKSIALDSNYIKTDNYCRRGISYFKKENYDLALSDFNKAIEDYSYNTMAYSCRGGVYLIKKEYDKAVMDYNKAIEMDSSKESTYYYNGRGLAYFGQEKFDDAISDYNHAIKIDNKNSQAYFNRAAVYDRLNNYDKAISDYNKFIELAPANAVGYDNVGYACIKTQYYDKAISSFNKCIELDKSNFDAMLGLAITYYLKNDTVKALQSLNQAILTEPELKKGMDGIKILEEKGYYYYDNDKIILKKLFDMVTK